MSVELYYFSGTGNSYAIARDLAKQLGTEKVYSITRFMDDKKVISKAQTVGIIFPSYFQDAPSMVVKFVKKMFVEHKNPYIFALVNANGVPGKSLHTIKQIFERKNTPLSGCFTIRMPGNSIVAVDHSTSLPVREYLLKSAEIQIEEIGKLIKNRVELRGTTKIYRRAANIDKFLVTTLVNDKTFRVEETCNKCGLCAKVCPVDNISVTDEGVKWLGKCQSCWGCLNWCPKEAVQNIATEGRLRYHNPSVSLNELVKARKGRG